MTNNLFYHQLRAEDNDKHTDPDTSRYQRLLPPLKDTDSFPFGRWQGWPMTDVPYGYLEWMVHETVNHPRVHRSQQWIKSFKNRQKTGQ